MENAVEATTILFNIIGGLGLFFTGVGVLWYVTVYKEKKEQYRQLAARSRLSFMENGRGADDRQLTNPGFDAASTQISNEGLTVLLGSETL